MTKTLFDSFFHDHARSLLCKSIDLALEEDGRDLTTLALFSAKERMHASVVAKEDILLAGLPLARLILERTAENHPFSVVEQVCDGQWAEPGREVLRLEGSVRSLLKAERVMLNFISHLSGVATLTYAFVSRLQGGTTRLLDTRKTLPGLRYPEKYAVRIGGGENHRIDLTEMLMLKDNHIDRAGSITRAVDSLRRAYAPCPPIEVECRTLAHVEEAVFCRVERIMLDNMSPGDIGACLERIPRSIQSEISGGVTLETVGELARLGADFISAGCITNSARACDLSMRLGNT